MLGVENQLTLARFGGERLLYRLSKSEFADRFILKGAALLLLWLGEPIRPTKDIDLLGFGDTSAEALKRVFVSSTTTSPNARPLSRSACRGHGSRVRRPPAFLTPASRH